LCRLRRGRTAKRVARCRGRHCWRERLRCGSRRRNRLRGA
jgi:hypothetical protein